MVIARFLNHQQYLPGKTDKFSIAMAMVLPKDEYSYLGQRFGRSDSWIKISVDVENLTCTKLTNRSLRFEPTLFDQEILDTRLENHTFFFVWVAWLLKLQGLCLGGVSSKPLLTTHLFSKTKRKTGHASPLEPRKTPGRRLFMKHWFLNVPGSLFFLIEMK